MKTKLLLTLTILLLPLASNSQWVRLTNGMGSLPVFSLAVNGNHIYAGTYLFGSGGVILSTNNGSSWTQTSLINRDIFSLAVKDNIIFAGTEYNGIYRSTNNGANWSQAFFTNHTISCMAVSGSNILAGTYDFGNGGVILSSNNGLNWVQTSLNNIEVLSLAVNGSYILTGTNGNGIYKSTNNGLNWVQTSLGNSYSINAIAVSGNNIFAGNSGNQYVVRSTNNGVNWSQPLLSGISVYTLAIIGNTVFAGTSPNSCYISTNNGANWTIKNEGFFDSNYVTIRAFYISNNFMYAGTANSNVDGVYRRPLSELVGIQPVSNEIPREFSLSQNYPNPFNPTTNFEFSIPLSRGVSEGRGVFVNLTLYDAMGREVETLINSELNPGTYKAAWDASNYPSGVYFYRLSAGDFTETKKMALIK